MYRSERDLNINDWLKACFYKIKPNIKFFEATTLCLANEIYSTTTSTYNVKIFKQSYNVHIYVRIFIWHCTCVGYYLITFEILYAEFVLPIEFYHLFIQLFLYCLCATNNVSIIREKLFWCECLKKKYLLQIFRDL